MSENNINGYANEQTTLSDSDWFDIDAYLGVDDYDSRKVSFGTIKNQILSQTNNVYNSNGTLTSSRTIDCDNKTLLFENAIFYNIANTNRFSVIINDFARMGTSSNYINFSNDFEPYIVIDDPLIPNNKKAILYSIDYSDNWDNTTDVKALVPLGFVTANGTTANRPTQGITGQTYFDTDLGYPIWFNGTNWVNSTGTVV